MPISSPGFYKLCPTEANHYEEANCVDAVSHLQGGKNLKCLWRWVSRNFPDTSNGSLNGYNHDWRQLGSVWLTEDEYTSNPEIPFLGIPNSLSCTSIRRQYHWTRVFTAALWNNEILKTTYIPHNMIISPELWYIHKTEQCIIVKINKAKLYVSMSLNFKSMVCEKQSWKSFICIKKFT